MITQIRNIYQEIALARAKTHKNRLEGPILPNVIIAVQNCIANRYECYISYEGDGENTPGKRWVQIYVYGLNKYTGNHIIRIYQTRGTSLTDPEGWKTFRMDRCRSTAVITSKTFNSPKSLYNPYGDGDMSSIFAQVKFDND